MQTNPYLTDWCPVSEKSRKELIGLMRNNKDKSYALKNELKAFISYLPSNKRKFKIEDMFLKESACKIKINSQRKKQMKEIIEKDRINDQTNQKNFYYKESNEMLSVTQFMAKYMDHLNMK